MEKMTSDSSLHTTSSSSHLLPPPILQHCTDQSIIFTPGVFSNPTLQDTVAYYKLFGRVATGSNVKVRVTDKHLPGLGIEVPARGDVTLMKVEGLQPNESYVFAVAAYTQTGEIVGGSIGLTGKPILACYPLPMLMIWGYCCQVHIHTLS